MLNLPRRRFLHLTASAAALPILPRFARAQSYPSRPVKIVVGFAAGGSADILARLMGQWLSDRLGQSFVIENRPGAGGNISTEMVVRAPSDGYTLLLVGPFAVINETLYDKLNFSFLRDIAPVASVSREPQVMVINPSVPANTVVEFIAYAKANPGKISMASAGIGTPSHVAGELFKMMTSVNTVHVPYRGAAPAVTDLIGGQVQVQFVPMASAIEHIKAGKLRALAVTTAMRSDALPGVPLISESVPGYEASGVYGIGAPKDTPQEVIARLNAEINAGLASPSMKARLAELGTTPLAGSSADFGKLLAEETKKWAQVVKLSGAKAD